MSAALIDALRERVHARLAESDVASRAACGCVAWVVAYSGGLDSTVLLHLLASGPWRGRVHAVHVHHGLQAEADGWPAHCAQVAAALAVPFECRRIEQALAPSGSVEAWAREHRYRALAAVANRLGDVPVLTAHHADDQAETVVLNALRGSGIDGLAGIGSDVRIAGARILRPMLAEPRAQLAAYARSAGLRWVEDPSNRDPRLLRNRIRLQWFPRAEKVRPDVRVALATLASAAREARARQQAQADLLLEDVCTDDGSGARLALSRGRLSALAPAQRALVLRAWLRTLGSTMPTAARLSEIDAQLALGSGPYGEVRHDGRWLRRYRDRICAMPVAAGAIELSDDWQVALRWTPVETTLPLPAGRGAIRFGAVRGGLDRAWLAGRALVFRPLRSADRIRLRADGPSRSVKNLFQELGAPRWARRGVPCLCIDGELAWTAPFGVDASAHRPRSDAGVVPVWAPPAAQAWDAAVLYNRGLCSAGPAANLRGAL